MTASTAIALATVSVGGLEVTHGHPARFMSRQWHGFSRPQTAVSSESHFADVANGRYDFWRVALDTARGPYTPSLLVTGMVLAGAWVAPRRRDLLLGIALGLAVHFWRDRSEPGSWVALL